MIEAFDDLWTQARDAFNQSRTAEKARSIAFGALTWAGVRSPA